MTSAMPSSLMSPSMVTPLAITRSPRAASSPIVALEPAEGKTPGSNAMVPPGATRISASRRLTSPFEKLPSTSSTTVSTNTEARLFAGLSTAPISTAPPSVRTSPSWSTDMVAPSVLPLPSTSTSRSCSVGRSVVMPASTASPVGLIAMVRVGPPLSPNRPAVTPVLGSVPTLAKTSVRVLLLALPTPSSISPAAVALSSTPLPKRLAPLLVTVPVLRISGSPLPPLPATMLLRRVRLPSLLIPPPGPSRLTFPLTVAFTSVRSPRLPL